MRFKAEIPTIASIFAVVLLCCSSATCEADTEFKASLGSFRHRLSKEIFRIYGDQDFVVSPFAIQACLAMLRMGAEGQTAFQMDRFMDFTNQTSLTVANNFHSMLAKYKDSDILKIANKIYVAQDRELSEDYKYLLSKKFYSMPENIPMQSVTTTAAYTMNAWVASKTNNAITALVWPEMFDADTRLVLLSATHFKGKWASAFPKENTKEANFYINKYSPIKVQMMEAKSTFQYGQLTKIFAMFIILPYKDCDLSMVIVLPYPTSKFSNLERKLKNMDLQKALKGAKIGQELMHVVIPKFKAQFQNELNYNLQHLGMLKMYSDSYDDFGEMLKYPERLTVSNVIQKTVFEVSEEGTKPQAADFDPEARMSTFNVFNASRPFYYAVINKDFLPLLEGTYIGK